MHSCNCIVIISNFEEAIRFVSFQLSIHLYQVISCYFYLFIIFELLFKIYHIPLHWVSKYFFNSSVSSKKATLFLFFGIEICLLCKKKEGQIAQGETVTAAQPFKTLLKRLRAEIESLKKARAL